MFTSPAWIQAAQLILSLALLITLHEGGHFLFARIFHIRVEKFFLFFDYRFHLFSTKDKWVQKLFPRLAALETEYGIGWIPLGGYVKIAGMIDESMDTEQMKQPAQPWEFRTKPAWQRLMVMLGGVAVNFVLALVIYSAVLFTWGKDVYPMKYMRYGFWYNETALELGFQQGDRPYSVDGHVFENLNTMELYTALCEGDTVKVVRGGRYVDIPIKMKNDLLQVVKQTPPLLAPYVPSEIDTVLVDGPAWKAGLRSGCRITSVDGTPILTWNEYNAIMSRRADVLAAHCTHEDSVRLKKVVVAYTSANHAVHDTVAVELNDEYKMGFVQRFFSHYCRTRHISYDVWESIPAGINLGITTLCNYVAQFKYMFSAEGAKSLGSFGALGSLFAPVWDWYSFWTMTAFLSIILFFMNLLPIPALDGGHALFCIVEMITGKQPGEKFLERAQYVGMALLLLLMGLAVYNDIVRFIIKPFLT